MNLAQAVERIRASIVHIGFHAVGLSREVWSQAGAPFVTMPLGTGFFVNSDGYVVTARHVVESGRRLAEQIQADTTGMYVGLAIPNTESMRGNFTLVQFDVIDEDARHDLALLKLASNPFKGEVRSGFVVGGEEVPLLFAAATLNPDRPADGEAVGISGYPLGQPVLVTNAGWVATSWSFDMGEDTVSGELEPLAKPDVADTFLADLQANPGNSGGPVYSLDNASVIGVCIRIVGSPIWDQHGKHEAIGGRTLFYSSGLTTVVPARYVIDLLRTHGLKWSEWTEYPG